MENDSLESEREKKYIDSGKKCSKITSNWTVLEKNLILFHLSLNIIFALSLIDLGLNK